ncbi:hypothetical protein EJ04DRAFT_397062, partial [Polyplosphaeria fusca]
LLAATALSQFDTRSADFALVISSTNSTLNNTILSACHEGAAIEGLCLATPSDGNLTYSSRFYTNTSSTSSSYGGILGYDLHILDDTIVPSSMIMADKITSNVAVPLFQPGDSGIQYIKFDDCGEMLIEVYVDDTTNPPFAYVDPPRELRNWLVCETNAGYKYQTLAWLVGDPRFATPQNPTCQKVEVRREF